MNLLSSAKNFIGNQFQFLGNHGFEMHLICSPDNDLENFASKQSIHAYPVPLNRQLSPKQDFKSLREIIKYIKKNKIDIVIGHQAKGRLLATIASFFTRIPFTIIYAHGIIFETSTGLKRKLLIWENKLESRLSDKVVCVSDFVKEKRLEFRIDNPSKQVKLGAGTCGGIDTINSFNPDLISRSKLSDLKTKLNIKEGDFIIGFVGRLVRDKGVIELIEAFNLLKNNYPDKSLKLMIVGSPEKRDGLPQETLEFLQTSQDIIYTGAVDHSKMNYHYACMDCLILPSHRDGFGMCNLEAQAMGVPVITSKITGCRESIKDRETGLYADLTPEDIAKKISILFDAETRSTMGNKAKDWVQSNFDHTKIWPHILKLLKDGN